MSGAQYLQKRMVSTVTGRYGRVYTLGSILQRPREGAPGIYQAECRGETYAVKCVPPSRFEGLRRVETQLSSSQHLRVHTDYNAEDNLLIYPFYKSILLGLMQEDPDFPPDERRTILRRVGEGLRELHSRDWMHADVKPDNVLVNWDVDEQGNKSVTSTVLGDFDIACEIKDKETRQTSRALGNVMWRSPEAQTGCGLSKASDIYSFGLMVIFTFGAGDLLLIQNYQELKEKEIAPEQEILVRHFSYFGPANDRLLERVVDQEWRDILKGTSEIARLEVKDNPKPKFEYWGGKLGEEAVDMISSMTNPDPTAGPTICQILDHRWWLI